MIFDMQKFDEIFQELLTEYQQSWLKYLLFWSPLAKILNDPNKASFWNFINTFMVSWSITRILFSFCIQNKENLLKLQHLAVLINKLKDADLFHESIFTTLSQHMNANALVDALIDLQKAGHLTPENQAALATYSKPYELASILINLKQANILTPETRNIVINHPSIHQLSSALVMLKQSGIYTEETRDMVARHESIDYFVLSLLKLQEANIYSSQNRDFVAKHPCVLWVSWGLYALHRWGILDEATFARVIVEPDPRALSFAFCALKIANIDSPENRDKIATCDNIMQLKNVLTILNRSSLLTTKHLDELLLIQHKALLTSEAIKQVWNKIPQNALNEALYQKLLNAAKEENPLNALEQVICETCLLDHSMFKPVTPRLFDPMKLDVKDYFSCVSTMM